MDHPLLGGQQVSSERPRNAREKDYSLSNWHHKKGHLFGRTSLIRTHDGQQVAVAHTSPVGGSAYVIDVLAHDSPQNVHFHAEKTDFPNREEAMREADQELKAHGFEFGALPHTHPHPLRRRDQARKIAEALRSKPDLLYEVLTALGNGADIAGPWTIGDRKFTRRHPRGGVVATIELLPEPTENGYRFLARTQTLQEQYKTQDGAKVACDGSLTDMGYTLLFNPQEAPFKPTTIGPWEQDSRGNMLRKNKRGDLLVQITRDRQRPSNSPQWLLVHYKLNGISDPSYHNTQEQAMAAGDDKIGIVPGFNGPRVP